MKILRVERVRRYEHYDIRDEVWDAGVPEIEPHLMKKLAYTKGGDWIGSSVQAYRLVRNFGITQFEKTDPKHCVCSIGFAPASGKWFGWSHRALHGFGLGDQVKRGHCAYVPATFEEMQVDCHCRQQTVSKTPMCGALASYPVVAKKPDGELIVSKTLEGVRRCCPEHCIFETGRGEWTATKMEEVKQMAIDFAKSVS